MRSSLFQMFRLCLIIGAFASLTACGIKPSSLDHPQNPDGTQYPRVYPDPESVK